MFFWVLNTPLGILTRLKSKKIKKNKNKKTNPLKLLNLLVTLKMSNNDDRATPLTYPYFFVVDSEDFHYKNLKTISLKIKTPENKILAAQFKNLFHEKVMLRLQKQYMYSRGILHF